MSETQQDQKGKDARTSGGQGGNTSEQETPTLTESQAKTRETKARSDALAEVGRLKKAADDANRIAQDVVRRLREREEADIAREEEAVRDEPEKLTTLRLRREASRKIAEAEEMKRTAEATQAETQTQRETQLQEIQQHRAERLSERYNVSPETLLKFGGTTKDSIEDLAKSYGERTELEGGTKTTRMTSAPDKGKTKGGALGGRKPTLEEVQAATPAEFDAKIKSGDWVLF